jgi:Asp/Glu/hydantoin racemase
VKLGADVILPMGIAQCPVHIKPDFLMKELGVPVVEGIGAPIRLAHMLVHLKLNYSRHTGRGRPFMMASKPSKSGSSA